MKNKFRIIILGLVFGFGLFFSGTKVKATVDYWTTVPHYNYTTFSGQLASQGYSCPYVPNGTNMTVVCWKEVKVTKTYLDSYSATKEDYRTLNGYAIYKNATVGEFYFYHVTVNNTPFLYLQNPPEGNISVKIDSERNKYYPKPAFNQENGWLINSKDDKLLVNGEEKDNLFYELETSKITLNRNGINFSSKEEVIDYLKNSDFLTKLGFSEEEKDNSLNYFIPKLKESKDNNYYYLTILSDKSIQQISELNINPKPENIIRQYFAVYPTPVPVKTTGELNFPKNQETNEFTAKETGEFLIEEPMQVFFE